MIINNNSYLTCY